jgi:hypothetical protein
MQATEKKKREVASFDLLDLKAPWQAWCAQKGLSQSEAIRGLILRELGEGRGEGRGVAVGSDKSFACETIVADDTRSLRGQVRAQASPKVAHRVYVGLSSVEFAAVQSLAEGQGRNATSWVTALVRARVFKAPQYSPDELKALVQSNALLLAIGRNLNQIAKVLNKYGDDATLDPSQKHYVQQADFMRAKIKAHVRQVSALTTANKAGWGIGR